MEPSSFFPWSLPNSGLSKQYHLGSMFSMMQVSLIHQEEAFIQSVSPCGCLQLNDNQNLEKTFKSTFFFFPQTSGEDSTSRVIRESIEESSACGCSRRPRTPAGFYQGASLLPCNRHLWLFLCKNWRHQTQKTQAGEDNIRPIPLGYYICSKNIHTIYR